MKDLSKCEQMVMEEIWNAEEIDMAGIKEKINKKGISWEKQTVSTFLHRIVKKGYAKGEKRGRYTYYRPEIDKDDYAEKLKREYKEFCKAAGVKNERITGDERIEQVQAEKPEQEGSQATTEI